MTDSRISEAWNVPEIHEQVRNEDDESTAYRDGYVSGFDLYAAGRPDKSLF